MSQEHMVCSILTIQPAKLAPVLALPALAVETHSVPSSGDALYVLAFEGTLEIL
nr:unnamed protein product [Callosobruchus chinensis]